MNADQLAEIRPAVREAMAGGPDACVTLEDSEDAEKWVQFVDSTINSAYPHVNDPEVPFVRESVLIELGGASVAGWEAGKYVTFELETPEVDALALFIDAVFVQILQCAPGAYHVNVSHQIL